MGNVLGVNWQTTGEGRSRCINRHGWGEQAAMSMCNVGLTGLAMVSGLTTGRLSLDWSRLLVVQHYA